MTENESLEFLKERIELINSWNRRANDGETD